MYLDYQRGEMTNMHRETDNKHLENTSYVQSSDLVAMTLTQQRKTLKRLEELEHQVMLLGKPRTIPPAAQSNHIVPVTSDVLDLVKSLLKYANNCIQHQRAVSDLKEIPPEQLQPIEDLTFELVSAIIRLALSTPEEIEVAKLAETVQLLTRVGLEIIRRFDALCKAKLSSPAELWRAEVRVANISDNNNRDLQVQKIAAEATRQIRGMIKDQFATDLASQIQRRVSGALAADVASLVVEKIQENLQQKIKDEVQRQLETPSVSDC
ncbi:hypothetical protein F4808DRAFT_75977 [Astrocystis sublimbata]|nr:hypothetical protein F4808DRAFT_75977 [Astrocystis sublimbata]